MANSEVEKGTKHGEEASVSLNFKTSVLRVSIHCEGCKRKVEKVLKKIPGVYKTEIDQKQQMVTVTGDIDAETLINRLRKQGKNAELWPQKPQKATPEEDQSAKVNSEGSGKEARKEKATQDSEPATDRAGAEAKEGKQEGEGNATASAGDRPAAEKQPVAGEAEGGAEKSEGNGSAGKKKKKKGQNGKNADGEVAHSGEAPASTVSGSEEQKNHGQCPKPNAADGSRPRQQAGQHPAPPHSSDVPAGLRSQHEGHGQGPTLVSPNHAAPRHHEHRYQPPHHAPPAYMFGYHTDPALSYHTANPTHPVSYHTENPSTSYAASHYDPNPPLYSHDYLHPGMVEERPPYYMSAYHSQPPESFEMFSDENPNACSIM
ncbi:hypothetical protein NL676_030834 [Syzygium grande]|nr:hypothetical protein NL676_030834 [Syzygium grande]